MPSITRKQRELQQARYDNFVRCCEGSPRLEAIAVAFRESGSEVLGQLLTTFTEYRHAHNEQGWSTPLIGFWVWEGLTLTQENCLAVDLHEDEVLMGISFLACETFLVSKEGK